METDTRVRPRDLLRLFIDRAVPDLSGTEWHELTNSDRVPIRVSAADLRHAKSIRETYRSEMECSGKDPDSISVIVDISVLVEREARDARRAVNALATDEHPMDTGSLTYIGTESGLRGLLDDIQAAGVADGITISSLAGHNDLGMLMELIQARQ
ncbi:hypothetical protein [Rhodococcus jostii]|uniref:Luciferase-like domain-containing protein n=1 Tax=Rhodococcus jostii TaxID=132919 RepID=A0A1H4QWV3_RHOJO|nr:hypothetical protein [Rhodococcus jostii]SEC24150.1 hypothetical protein SAMN04490220_1141 [Rhodococcus jostii]